MTTRPFRKFTGEGRSKWYPCAQCGAPKAGRSHRALCPEHRAESRRAAKAKFYTEDANGRAQRYRANKRRKEAEAKRLAARPVMMDSDIALYRAEKAKRAADAEARIADAKRLLGWLEIGSQPKRGRPRKTQEKAA